MAVPFNPPSALNMPHDPAEHHELHMQGYPRLAYFFSQAPDYIHLRRFSGLSARLLLYRQHELVVLEKKLIHFEIENEKKQNTRIFNKDFQFVTCPGQGASAQEHGRALFELLEEIRYTLKAYGEHVCYFRFLRCGLQ
jgi:hypothetical protein